MPHHEQLLHDPIGTLRRIWDDTGWRTMIIAAVLVFLLETFLEISGAGPELSAGWAAMLISLILISRALTLRPLRGDLPATENLAVVLGVAGVVVGEMLISFTSLGGTFAAEPIYWPFSLLFCGILLGARAIAPYAVNPLAAWWLLFSLMVFGLHLAMWHSQASVPETALTWGATLTFLALLSRWIVGRGFSGPVVSPLNVALALYVFLAWWLEYGANASGVGADPWGTAELFWPWLVFTLGLAAGSCIAAGALARRIGSD
ncbi:MAG: hypothetical protein OXI41_06250 [Chloroflexota bacterium]|nr:hypothetical protein [Chloroflexota bacterium]MDE2894506.1 hypothetical protein [Chloroflexota bacterium]